MVRPDLRKGSGGERESKALDPRDMRIEFEIREIVRIYPKDVEAFMSSFNDWASNWE